MKNKICGIYKITSPTGKIYIGQAVDINDRWGKYKRLDCKRQPKLYASFKKYGVESHKFEIAEECIDELLNEREIYYVKFYNSFNTPHGLNLQEGGNHGRPSDETKLKIGIGNKGRIKSPEEIEKNRIAHTGKKQSPDTIEKRVSKIRGKKKSADSIKKLIDARRSNGMDWHSKETKEKMKISPKNKSIYQIDKNTNEIINIFISIKEASRTLNVFSSGISGCLRKKVRTAYNYKWQYCNDEIPLLKGTIIKYNNEVSKLDQRKNSIEWNSDEMKKKRNAISQNANKARLEIRQERLTMIF